MDLALTAALCFWFLLFVAGFLLGGAFPAASTKTWAAFYRLYRSLQTYRQALADAGGTLVLSPDSAFLHAFRVGPGSAPEGSTKAVRPR